MVIGTIAFVCITCVVSIIACIITVKCMSSKDSKCAMTSGGVASTFCSVTLSIVVGLYFFMRKGPQ